MDMLGVSNNHGNNNKKQSSKRGKKDNFKVTYISSPMKVKTSASKFRAVVQELTGQDSNVAETIFMEEQANNNNNNGGVNNYHHHQKVIDVDEAYALASTTTPANWLKPDYTEFLLDSSRASPIMIEPLQYDLLNFDMMY